MYQSALTRFSALVLLVAFLHACGKEENNAPKAGGTPSPVAANPEPQPDPVEVPFQERLEALEKNPQKCTPAATQSIKAIDKELRELHIAELAKTHTLLEAENVDTSLNSYFARIRALAASCEIEDLSSTSPQDAIVGSFLKTASCEGFDTESVIVARSFFQGQISQSNRLALTKLLVSCGHGDPTEVETKFYHSRLGFLEIRRRSATKNSCSLDSRYFSEESLEQIGNDYQAISKPSASVRLLALQSHLDLALRFRRLIAGCSGQNLVEPSLALQELEAELAKLEARQESCQNESALSSLRSRALQAEAADLEKILSRQYNKIAKERYQALIARTHALEAGCEQQKQSNWAKARVHGLKTEWQAFVSREGYTEERLAQSQSFLARVGSSKAQDLKLHLGEEKKAELLKAYTELEQSISRWQAACRTAIAAEKERKRAEEEKQRQQNEQKRKQEEERKRTEEQKRKQEEERKRAEEEKQKQQDEQKRKQEEERKRAEEQKRKQEEDRKRAEEEKQKQQNEQKRKQEEERQKRLEEQKRKKEEERKRIEEEKRKKDEERRKIEEQKRRKEEERKRAEQEQYRSVEEKRQRLTPPMWEKLKKPSHKLWTNTVLSVVRKRMKDFDQARDADTFCPGYHKAELHERENCWVMMIAAIAYKESNYKLISHFVEGNGVPSIGFLALSAGECPNAPRGADLNDPVKNLTCGTNIMARLIAKDKMISDTDIGPDLVQRRPGRGAAAYWSTLKPKHRVYHRLNKRWYTVGFKHVFVEWLRDYKKLRR